MQTIGSYLKSGREARNIRLSDVARSTKISKWYLDCLEKDEFDKIPEGPYIKGYIASYASYIGLEEDEILKRYDSLQTNGADDKEYQDHLPQNKIKKISLGFPSAFKIITDGLHCSSSRELFLYKPGLSILHVRTYFPYPGF